MLKSEPCDRCGKSVEQGLPETSWDQGGFRFSGSVERVVWRIRFSYLKLRGWRDAPTASDVLHVKSHTNVSLCDGCWGDVLNFIVTTKPDSR